MTRIIYILILGAPLLLTACSLSGAESSFKYLTAQNIENGVAFEQNYHNRETDVAKSYVIAHLIEREAIYQQSKSRDLSVSDQEVNVVVEDMIQTTNENKPEEFQRFLDALDLSMKEYFWDYAYDKYRYSLLKNKLFERCIQEGKADQWVEEFKGENQKEIKELVQTYKENAS